VLGAAEFADQEPQGETSQLNMLQVTPEFVVSFVTTAITGALAFVNIVLGGAWVTFRTTAFVTVNVIVTLKLWFAAAVAVIVTVLPTIMGKAGDGAGTVNVAEVPGSVWAEEPNPDVQLRVPQVAVQFTPELEGSPATTAVRFRNPPAG
jgi:hypothetical protein